MRERVVIVGTFFGSFMDKKENREVPYANLSTVTAEPSGGEGETGNRVNVRKCGPDVVTKKLAGVELPQVASLDLRESNNGLKAVGIELEGPLSAFRWRNGALTKREPAAGAPVAAK